MDDPQKDWKCTENISKTCFKYLSNVTCVHSMFLKEEYSWHYHDNYLVTHLAGLKRYLWIVQKNSCIYFCNFHTVWLLFDAGYTEEIPKRFFGNFKIPLVYITVVNQVNIWKVTRKRLERYCVTWSRYITDLLVRIYHENVQSMFNIFLRKIPERYVEKALEIIQNIPK